jgi:hypothetical protein
MYTFAQLKADVRPMCFPAGEARNLVSVHDKLFVEAMIMVQEWVDQYQINNTQIFPFCSTFFQCGLTVFQAPRGAIKNVRTYVRLNDQCREDDASNVNYCSEVIYTRIEYPNLKQGLDRQLRCACNGIGFDSLFNLSLPICQKTLRTAYPPPTDADYVGYPELPLGFHYPQDSTDLTYRAKVGVWALERGRIYLGPWINSAEIVVVDWDGKKRDWIDADIVDEEADVMLQTVVKQYVLMCHYRDYDKDMAQYEANKAELYGNRGAGIIGSLPTLQHRFREETRARAKSEDVSFATGAHKTLQGQSVGAIT